VLSKQSNMDNQCPSNAKAFRAVAPSWAILSACGTSAAVGVDAIVSKMRSALTEALEWYFFERKI